MFRYEKIVTIEPKLKFDQSKTSKFFLFENLYFGRSTTLLFFLKLFTFILFYRRLSGVLIISSLFGLASLKLNLSKHLLILNILNHSL